MLSKAGLDTGVMECGAHPPYDEAARLYLEASEGAADTNSAKNAARVGRIFALYGKVMLARTTGNSVLAVLSRTLTLLLRNDDLDTARCRPEFVTAMLDLYPGTVSDPLAPWPTRRVPPRRCNAESPPPNPFAQKLRCTRVSRCGVTAD